jgi:hypothetical protein
MREMNTGFFQRTEDFRPILVRLLARRKNGPPVTADELSNRSGLPLQKIQDISWAPGWEEITVSDMKSFIVACEVNFESARSMSRVYTYLQSKPEFEYLRVHQNWKSVWLPMLARWRNSYPMKLDDGAPHWKPIRDLLTRINHLHKSYERRK